MRDSIVFRSVIEMALNYFPLISRAVARLEKNTGESRRALYDGARSALLSQLRRVVPALDEHEITRERRAGAEIVARIHDHDDRSRCPGGRRWRIAGHRKSGRRQNKANDEGKDAGHARQG